MPLPIFSIEDSAPKTKAVANLLPCRVQYDGLIDPIDAYWKPTKEDDGSQTAYFRGRKLQGKTVSLPRNYRGVIMRRKPNQQKTEKMLSDVNEDVVIVADSAVPETEQMEVTAEFDDFVVWGHEAVADAATDQYIRGIEEWLSVADKIHWYPEQDTSSSR